MVACCMAIVLVAASFEIICERRKVHLPPQKILDVPVLIRPMPSKCSIERIILIKYSFILLLHPYYKFHENPTL